MKRKQQRGCREQGRCVGRQGDWAALPVPCDRKPSGSSEAGVLCGERVTGPTIRCFQAAELDPRYSSGLRGSAHSQAAKRVLKEWAGCLRGLAPLYGLWRTPRSCCRPSGLLGGTDEHLLLLQNGGGSGLRFKRSYLKYPWDV